MIRKKKLLERIEKLEEKKFLLNKQLVNIVIDKIQQEVRSNSKQWFEDESLKFLKPYIEEIVKAVLLQFIQDGRIETKYLMERK